MSEFKGFGQKIDRKIIIKAQAGESAAIEAIYNTYAKACYLLALRVTANPQSAQDIVHEVFLKVLKKINQYKAEGNFAGWLRQIAANESINYLKRHSKLSLDVELDGEIESYDRFETQWWDTVKDLQKLTSKLTDTCRTVLFLHELEGFSHKEIASMFGKSESFSKQSLSRAISQLKNMSAIKEISNASH